jgi:hypothetical protein
MQIKELGVNFHSVNFVVSRKKENQFHINRRIRFISSTLGEYRGLHFWGKGKHVRSTLYQEHSRIK